MAPWSTAPDRRWCGPTSACTAIECRRSVTCTASEQASRSTRPIASSRPASSTSTPTSTRSSRGTRSAPSSCWHGVTSVVMGNCGVTFAPCSPDDREYLAEMMESVEDIPATPSSTGCPWDWDTYGEYLASVDSMAKGINVGGMVGHCAVRYHAMGERSLDEEPATDGRHRGDVRARRRGDARGRSGLLDVAHAASIACPTVAPCRARRPRPRSCSRSPTSSAATGAACSRPLLGSASATTTRSPTPRPRSLDGRAVAPNRASGHVRAGAVGSPARPVCTRRSQLTEEGNPIGGRVRPQTTARGIGILFGLANNTPYGRCACVAARSATCRSRIASRRCATRSARGAHRRSRRRAGVRPRVPSSCSQGPTLATTAPPTTHSPRTRLAVGSAPARRSSTSRSRPTARPR